MANIVAALKAHCPALAAAAAAPQLSSGSATTILPMRSEEDLAVWERLDDVIMVGCKVLAAGAAGAPCK